MTDPHDAATATPSQPSRSLGWQIRNHLHGPTCPGPDALGELAYIEPLAAEEPDSGNWFEARIYIWRDDVTAAQAAGWFKEAGAVDVEVLATLHDEYNNIVEGRSTDDGARPWDVRFRIPGDQPTTSPPTIRVARYHWQGQQRQLPADRLLDALDLEDGATPDTLSITFATVANPHAAAPGAHHGN